MFKIKNLLIKWTKIKRIQCKKIKYHFQVYRSLKPHKLVIINKNPINDFFFS